MIDYGYVAVESRRREPPPMPVVVVAAHSSGWVTRVCHSSGKEEDHRQHFSFPDIERYVSGSGLRLISAYESPDTWWD